MKIVIGSYTLEDTILCCAKGEPARYISESNSGVVIEPENSQALAEAIIRLFLDPKLALVMGKNGRNYIERNVTIRAIGAKAKALFLKIRQE